MFLVDGVPFDGVLAQTEVQGVVAHRLCTVAVQQERLGVVHQILDGVLRSIRLVSQTLTGLIDVRELALQIFYELTLVAVMAT